MVKYIADLSKSELEELNVIICRQQDEHLCILIKANEPKFVSTSAATSNLEIAFDKSLLFENRRYFFHIIKSKQTDELSIKRFKVIYNYIFAKITSPIKGSDLRILIDSLQDYFGITADKDCQKLRIGVFGELLFAKKIFDAGFVDIFNLYHRDFFSKHDIEINSHLRLEIKTSVAEKRIHRFKHNQINRNDVRVLVGSVMLEDSSRGLTLFDLFQQVIDIGLLADVEFALRKLMLRCGVDENDKGPSFSEQNAYDNIAVFEAKYLPRLDGIIPNGLSNIEYDVDCSLATPIDFQVFVEELIGLQNNP